MNIYSRIMNTPLPPVQIAHLREKPRKEWAKAVRALLKSLDLKDGISVTTPGYSMAQSISVKIATPEGWGELHTPVHEQKEQEEREKGAPYMGMVHVCPFCQRRAEARQHLEEIILTAFPDLDDRSDTTCDYFDFCITVEA